jgi:hypothetical protein
VWTLGSSDFQGVRVHCASNAVERKISTQSKVEEISTEYRIGHKAA